MQTQDSSSDRLLWLGLESYTESYSDIFYGRTEEIEKLSADIYNNVQTVIYGPSGTGKTSIIRAGIFLKAREHKYMPVYVRLNHDPHNPNQRDYTHQIINAIQEEARSKGIDIDQVVSYIGGECNSLWEFFHCNEFWSADNYPVIPMVVLDQFEEMFTLGKNSHIQDNFFEQLSDLIDNKYPQYIRQYLANRDNKHIEYLEGINFRSVISMREDFLARLEEHAQYIPALKRNRFSLQCINEEQSLEIIMKPLPGLVSEEVAVQIIEKVTNKRFNKDFTIHDQPDIEVEPSILSLFCRELDKKRRERGMNQITSELVNEFGDNIIKDFYNGAIAQLSTDKVDFIEAHLLTSDGFRDAVALGNARNAGITDEDIAHLTDNRLVRIEEWDGTKRMEFTHDVLCKVAMEHRAERDEEKRRQELEYRLKRRNRKWMIGLGTALAIALIGFFGYWMAFNYKVENYYAAFTTQWGWPVGIGEPLSESQRDASPLYYKLSHKGLVTKYNDEVEICSSNGALPLSGRLADLCVDEEIAAADPVAQNYLDKLNRVAKIQYEGKNQKVDRETYLDENGDVLFFTNYFPFDNGNGDIRTFVTPQGLTMPVRGLSNGHENQLDRMKMTWNDQGRIESIRFFNDKDLCVEGINDIYGYRYIYPDEHTVITYNLDKFGRPINQKCNALVVRDLGDSRVTEYCYAYALSDSTPEIVTGPEGFAKIVEDGDVTYLYHLADLDNPAAQRTVNRDEKGNILQIAYEGDVPLDLPILSLFAYEPTTGYRISEQYLDAQGEPFAMWPNDIYKREVAYYDGQLSEERRTDIHGAVPYNFTTLHEDGRTVQRWQDLSAPIKDLTLIDSILVDGYKSMTYYADGNRPINVACLEGIDSLTFHKKTYIENDTLSDCRYYVYEDGRIEPMPTVKGRYGKVKSYFRKVEKYDPSHILLSRQIYDADDNVLKSMMYLVQDGQTIGRSVLGIDGNAVRCPEWEWEGLTYYRLYYTSDRDDNFNSIEAVNELGEPSAFYDDEGYYTLASINYQDSVFWNAHHDRFRIRNQYYQTEFIPSTDISTTKLAFLHMLSRKSPLYQAGLRDGDRILELDNWVSAESPVALAKTWKQLRDGNKHHMRVLRPHDGQWEVLDFEVDLLPDAELEEYHLLNLTNQELKEFKSIFK